MAKYSVALHGHAAVRIEVEARTAAEANRKAVLLAPNNRHVKSWTPVSTSKLEGR